MGQLGGAPCLNRHGQPKRRWATKAAAYFVADWQTTIRKNPSYAYRCPECDRWHISTKSRKRSIQ